MHTHTHTHTRSGGPRNIYIVVLPRKREQTDSSTGSRRHRSKKGTLCRLCCGGSSLYTISSWEWIARNHPHPFFFLQKKIKKRGRLLPRNKPQYNNKKKTTTTINNTETKHNSNETHVSLLCELHCTKEFFFSLRRNQKAAKRFFFFASSVPPITICNNEKNPVC
jgi:hypothetical protein